MHYCFHRVSESVATVICKFQYIPGESKPADVLSKRWSYSDIWRILRPLMFVMEILHKYLFIKDDHWIKQCTHIKKMKIFIKLSPMDTAVVEDNIPVQWYWSSKDSPIFFSFYNPSSLWVCNLTFDQHGEWWELHQFILFKGGMWNSIF